MSPVMISDASWYRPIRAALSASSARPKRTFPITHSACAIIATSSVCSLSVSVRAFLMSAHRSIYFILDKIAKKLYVIGLS